MVSIVRRLLILQLLCASVALGESPWLPRAEKVIRRVLENLEQRQRRELAVAAWTFDDSPLPHPRPGTNAVVLSPAFLVLAERLSLAIARDEHRQGYLDAYLLRCGQTEGGIGELPDWPDASVGADRIENEQITAFNQLVATVIATEFCHHILGHHQTIQRRSQHAAGVVIAVKSVVSEGDNRRAFRDGIAAAVRSGYTTETLRQLAISLGRTSVKPSWYVWLFPPKPVGETLVKELKKAEDKALGR